MTFPTKPSAVIVDVDGTLCDVTDVLHHVTGKVKNFDAFHEASADCPPNQVAVDYVDQAARDGHAIVIVTGRVEKHRQLTETWLDRYLRLDPWGPQVHYHGPFMRPDNDFRPDVIIKREILDELTNTWRIVGAIDDNPNIVELWEGLGIPTVVVPRPEGDTSLERPTR